VTTYDNSPDGNVADSSDTKIDNSIEFMVRDLRIGDAYTSTVVVDG
jgi:hypothetical protein